MKKLTLLLLLLVSNSCFAWSLFKPDCGSYYKIKAAFENCHEVTPNTFGTNSKGEQEELKTFACTTEQGYTEIDFIVKGDLYCRTYKYQ